MANGFLINCFSSLPAWPALGEIKEKGRFSFLLQDEQNFTLDYANFFRFLRLPLFNWKSFFIRLFYNFN